MVGWERFYRTHNMTKKLSKDILEKTWLKRLPQRL